MGYILAPNPTIMKHAVEHKMLQHDKATEDLITKLLLDPALVGDERKVQRARFIDSFMDKYSDFTVMVCLPETIIGSWLQIMRLRHTSSIRSIPIIKQKCWAGSHVLCCPRYQELEQLRGTGSK